ncbi:hypothetical protein OHB33_36875 [Streptomyces sp. NBC_01558]|uniref:hypothetical protein n=1 Tax=Streptomyces sp. NBC_01558 TaxID=2975878 RepID=UPI002DDA5A48|nr:hypothetical protein [Streptomyces sp. NBC_01558]WSD81466.1 hypothetical protein OHB33_36875 [Streptomyces sp. NBC_01558]
MGVIRMVHPADQHRFPARHRDRPRTGTRWQNPSPLRRPATLRVTFAAIAALVTAACAADPAPTADPTPPAPVSAARLSAALPDDPVRMVLPATGAETRWTQGLDVFVRQEVRAVAASCAHDHGTEPPTQDPVTFIRYYELPDLDFVTRHGMSGSAAVPVVTPGPVRTDTGARSGKGKRGGAGDAGDTAVVRRCVTEGTAAATALRDTYAALQGQWFGTLVPLRHDPAVLRALRTLPGCLARRGIRVRDENGFFALADARQQTTPADRLPAVERALGSAYADCMRPVEAVREPARLRLRARFLADHAAEVRTLRANLLPALRRAAKAHGLRLVFPAP